VATEIFDSYGAFISYKASSSSAQARSIRKTLLSLAARHHSGNEFRVFVDENSLLVGDLTAKITDALERSDHLVVLLARDTKGSPWVEREIAYWLSHGGAADRLFLVRVDPDLDLTWNDRESRFEHPELLPPSLRSLFRAEQKWLDLKPELRGANEATLSVLYAAIAGVDTATLLLEEAEFQRRRRRVIAGVGALMAVLLVVSLVAGLLAIRGQSEARRQRDVAERAAVRAQAEADAAAALLALPSSGTLAIHLGLAAAQSAATPSVRSALLSIASETGRLVAAVDFPERANRHPSGAAFAADGNFLATWSEQTEGVEWLQLDDLGNGRTAFTGPVELDDIDDLVVVSSRWLLVCTPDGAVRMGLDGQTVELEEVGVDRLEDAPVVECRVDPLGSAGAVARITRAGDDPDEVVTMSASGLIDAWTGGSNLITTDQESMIAGSGGVWVIDRYGQRAQVSDSPSIGEGYGDGYGTFFVRVGDHDWRFVVRDGSAWHMRKVPVPDSAVDVAPAVYVARFTGAVAWIDANGIVTSPGQRSLRVGNENGEDAWGARWRTRLVPFSTDDFLAVFGHTATIVKMPSSDPIFDGGYEWANHEGGWRTKIVPKRLGVPDQDGADPVIPGCEGPNEVALHTDLGTNGGLIVDASADNVTFDAMVAMDGCRILDGDSELTAQPSGVVLRPSYAADSAVLSSDRVALLTGGAPTEVLDAGREYVNNVWGFANLYQPPQIAGLGTRSVDVDAQTLLFVGPNGLETAADVPFSGSISAVRPDGKAAVVTDFSSGSRNEVVGDAAGPMDVSRYCAEPTPVRYVPGTNFRGSVADAEEQILAGADNDGLFECTTGERLGARDPVLAYGIDSERGQIVTRDAAGETDLVLWSRGESQPTVRQLPALDESDVVSIAPDGETMVAADPAGRRAQLYHWQSGRWQAESPLLIGVRNVVAANLVDGASLLLVTAADGAFELLDTEAGRRLIVQTDAVLPSGIVTSVDTQVVGGTLYATLHINGQVDDAVQYDIPIDVDILVELLCQTYRDPACPS
jgi:hypothetical protein